MSIIVGMSQTWPIFKSFGAVWSESSHVALRVGGGEAPDPSEHARVQSYTRVCVRLDVLIDPLRALTFGETYTR
jgi:hypothetical protein